MDKIEKIEKKLLEAKIFNYIKTKNKIFIFIRRFFEIKGENCVKKTIIVEVETEDNICIIPCFIYNKIGEDFNFITRTEPQYNCFKNKKTLKISNFEDKNIFKILSLDFYNKNSKENFNSFIKECKKSCLIFLMINKRKDKIIKIPKYICLNICKEIFENNFNF